MNGELQLKRVNANGRNAAPKELDDGHTNQAASVASGLEESGGGSSHAQTGEPAAAGGEQRSLRLHRKLLFSVGGLPYQLTGNAYARAASRRRRSARTRRSAACIACVFVCARAASAST